MTEPRRIVVATDSFKGSLTAQQATSIIAEAFAPVLPDAEVVSCPLADGGEGTAEILAPYLPDDICLIESAELIGLNLPEMRSLDVMNRSSYPLGAAILAGLDAGKRNFVIALGGSATNDCGLGMLTALGMQAVDSLGEPVEPTPSGLLSLAFIDVSTLDSRLSESRITVLTDVTSPLCGENGATAVYGPQKGVHADDIAGLDRAVELFAIQCRQQFGADPSLMPGAGAAGGLGFALMLLSGEMLSGADFVMNATGIASRITGADWVVTGEGRSDAQTLNGKLPYKVAELARRSGAKAALLSGSVDRDALSALAEEFELIASAQPQGVSNVDAIKRAGDLLAEAATRLGKCIGQF